MKRLKLSFILCSGLLISSQGFADAGIANDINVSHSGASEQGFYIGATLGSANYDVMDESDIGFDLFAGFNFNEVLSAELGWVSFGEVENSGITAEASAFHLAVLGNVSLQNDLSFYGKLGMTSWDVDFKSNVGSGSDSGADVFFGLGMDYQIGARSSVRFGADWYSLDVEDIALYSIGIKQTF
ncbi:MAG: outer membrane beta-barrel protein [Pseudomonadales bacterium]|nr:outer membrane beta-barrel protein [Pseudomonadales bacterium]